MMKKRIILVVACLMMVLSSSCLAANWVWVTSDSRMGFFFDSDSIKVYETEGKPKQGASRSGSRLFMMMLSQKSRALSTGRP